MAKKEAKEMSVEQKLQALYELQTTLTAIDEKRALRGELPLEVQDLEDEIAGLDTRIEKIDTEIKEFQSAITMKKGEVQEAQANLERYNNQLNEVRNNREYDSLSKQIDYERLEVELCNKKIKEATDQVAYRTNDLEIAKTERESVRRILTRKERAGGYPGRDPRGGDHAQGACQGLGSQDRAAPPQFLQAHPQECAQRTGYRLCAA